MQFDSFYMLLVTQDTHVWYSRSSRGHQEDGVRWTPTRYLGAAPHGQDCAVLTVQHALRARVSYSLCECAEMTRQLGAQIVIN